MQLEGVEQHRVKGVDCELSVLTCGPEDGQPLVLLHGMRDVAVSLLFSRRYFPECRIIAPDLRGHGDSGHPGVYGLLQYIMDLRQIFDHFALEATWLVGHSLGGHIVTRFTSLYPELVARLAVLDGMGPPHVTESTSETRSFLNERWRNTVALHLEGQPTPRMIPDVEDAARRLQRNNPGLDQAQAQLLATAGTRSLGDGVCWKWDPRIDMMWMSFSHIESENAWQDIACPVLIVTGEHSLNYWTDRRLSDDSDIEALRTQYQSELKRREALFQDARHIELPGAGHMLHYDQPDALGQLLAEFMSASSAD